MIDHPSSDTAQTVTESEPPSDPKNVGERFAALYPDLRRMARARLRDEQPLTLFSTTALVHETYLDLARRGHLAQVEQRSFLAYAARAMRSILVDHARARQTQRRGERVEHVPLDDELAERLPAAPEDEILHVHDALGVLAQAEPRLAQTIEMAFFAGMTEAEMALALGVSERTVRRDLGKAKLLLEVALR
jgi:RNA polymerase sigma factor (TIGR02999 family)